MKDATFLSTPFVRIGESARMWFLNSDIATRLGIGKKALVDRMRAGDAGPFNMVPVDVKDLRVFAKRDVELNRSGQRGEPYVELDYFLAAAFSMATEQAHEVRDFVSRTVNTLMYDGFVSLAFEVDENLRRALCAFVCGSDNFYAIAKDRFDPTDEARGTNYAPTQLTEQLLVSPHSYMRREEITRVRALELGLHLITTHGLYKKEANSFLISCGINVLAMCGTEQDRDTVSEWLLQRHHATTHRSR